ncbi:MAG: hypothetical protein QOI15_772 [Pseudonocardiales bacterium]|nr:hypothetical protein [Pseudonocardiales bacterium]
MTRAATLLAIFVLALAGAAVADATGARPSARTAKQCVVPNVQKLTLARAKSRLAAAGCKVGRVTNTNSATIKKGHVISQSPAPGKRIASTRHVSLTVSIGSAGTGGPPALPCANCPAVTYG